MITHAARPAGWLADRTLLGVAIFVGSESIFFLSIVVAYVANRDAGLSDARLNLDLARTTIFSLALFASSATMARATATFGVRWVLATVALGAIFIVGQGSEYARLLAAGTAPSSAMFGTTFFTLTGLHGAHVLVGLAALTALALANAANAKAVRPVAWEAVGLYWHFVDAVWVVVFSVVYLGTRV
jgi:heme/copper-type cytochrome/quinol oxidase subunit 3